MVFRAIKTAVVIPSSRHDFRPRTSTWTLPARPDHDETHSPLDSNELLFRKHEQSTKMATRIHRVTMFKIPNPENQKKLLEAYKVLARDQNKVRAGPRLFRVDCFWPPPLLASILPFELSRTGSLLGLLPGAHRGGGPK